MPRFLRGVKKSRWDTFPDVPWLGQGELKADVFRDLSPENSSLSIWEVPDHFSTERIAVALAATRNHLGPMDFVVFDDLPQPLDMATEQTLGDTPDREVNSLHYDVQRITAHRLLAVAVHISGGTYTRIQQTSVKSGLQDGIRRGQLRTDRLTQELKLKLGI